jgi:hypothetical protein
LGLTAAAFFGAYLVGCSDDDDKKYLPLNHDSNAAIPAQGVYNA